jgi:multiple sugar transport system substrate-binding protein
MFDFFRLHEFIHPNSRMKSYNDSDLCYFRGETAVLFGGQWVLQVLSNPGYVSPSVAEPTYIAPAPGISYVGAAHLVIWRHSIHADEAFQLVRHITSPEVLLKVFYRSGGFPARLDVLSQPPFSTDERFRMVRDSLKRGRGFRSARLWAGVEMRLNEMSDQLWADLFANPDLNLAQEIEQRVKTTAERLEKTLLAG